MRTESKRTFSYSFRLTKQTFCSLCKIEILMPRYNFKNSSMVSPSVKKLQSTILYWFGKTLHDVFLCIL